jgi:serine/threonine protein kinase
MSHKNRRRNSLVTSSTTRPVAAVAARDVDLQFERPHPGMSVAGRFRIERRVASGAMGEVWQGVHCDLQLRVAIKTLRKDMIANHEVVARFTREAFLLGRIQSDHVVRVLDFASDRRLGPVLVTEFVDGPSLASMLEARRLSVEEGVDLAIDLLGGLRELHRARIVHRDVKPANVLMRSLGDGEQRAVFVDLGVSRLVPDDSRLEDCLTEITTADRAVGTIEYMAPEQILSSRNVTAAADLYAVGAILYRAVSGQHAFSELHGVDLMKRKLSTAAPPLRTGRTDPVAKGFEEVVARALAAPPGERYEVADEMLADLSLLRDAARRAAAKKWPSVPPAVPEQTHEAVRALPPTAATARRAVMPVVVAAICALAGLAAGVGVEMAAESRRRLADPSPIGAAPGGWPCTLTQQLPPPAGARSAFTIVCDRRRE